MGMDTTNLSGDNQLPTSAWSDVALVLASGFP
jgi:hypothetical protein